MKLGTERYFCARPLEFFWRILLNFILQPRLAVSRCHTSLHQCVYYFNLLDTQQQLLWGRSAAFLVDWIHYIHSIKSGFVFLSIIFLCLVRPLFTAPQLTSPTLYFQQCRGLFTKVVLLCMLYHFNDATTSLPGQRLRICIVLARHGVSSSWLVRSVQ